MNFEEAVEFIENTPRFVNNGGRNKSGNDNLKEVMKLLKNPQDEHPCIHIAGTNGKGSTVRFTMSILACMGYRVGTFISPHLERINERIAVSYLENYSSHIGTSGDVEQADTGTWKSERLVTDDITDEAFLAAFEKVMAAVRENVEAGGAYLSYFEMLFAVSAVFFAEQRLDYVIYETGLGGRLDATNIVMPEITAITSIGLDHTAYLGNTIKEIAGEKAGIIKNGVPVIFNTGEAEADEVIIEQAKSLGARAINVAKANYIVRGFTDKTIDFSFVNSYYSYHDIEIKVAGALYQLDNAATAITLCNVLFEDKGVLPERIIRKAMKLFSWAGRMEKIGEHIIVDGAHNEDAIRRYTEAVNVISGGHKVTIMFAVSSDKDYEPMIEHLAKELTLKRVFVTSLASSRAVSAEYIAGLFEKHCSGETVISSCDDIRTALIAGLDSVRADNEILFCVGSLYLVGSIKELAREILDND